MAVEAFSGQLVDSHGCSVLTLDRPTIEERLAAHEVFWLDLVRPSDAELELIGETFGFHPLAIEDSQNFGQRAKVEDYGGFTFLVVFGHAPDEDGLVEVHAFYSERFLVTVRRDEAPALATLRERYRQRPGRVREPILLLYELVDALVDSFLAPLSRFDERLGLIEEVMFREPSEAHLKDIFAMRRRLVSLGRVIASERALFDLQDGLANLPGLTTEAERRFRDVHDHLIRLGLQIDGSRELMTSAIDAYMSTASNRLNSVIKQLTLVASIFLPLSFLAGFFGQNFGWLVENVASWQAFVGVGIGVQLLALAILLVFFKRRGWF